VEEELGRQEIVLGFGSEYVKVTLEENRILGIVKPKEQPGVKDQVRIVEETLTNPIGKPPLKELVTPTSRIAIIVNDLTRPTPSLALLTPVLRTLKECGLPDQNVTLIIGLGTHRPVTHEEKTQLIGEDVARRYRCINSVDDGFVALGRTSRGTLVELAKAVAHADLCICTGNVEFHYFAGYTGGAKAIMPGTASRDAVSHNHSFQLLPGAIAGKCEGNPVREDIEEAVDFLPNVFIVNAVLNERKEMVACVAGDFRQAHRTACRVVDRMYKIRIEQRAKVVLASAGGFPKDINLYQAHKALENAAHAVERGGSIVFVASCSEGLGNEVFARWIREASDPKDILERFKGGFELGGHKAAAIARVVMMAKVFLVSSLDRSTAESLYFVPSASVQQAVDAALDQQGPDAKVLVMPFAGSTLPSAE